MLRPTIKPMIPPLVSVVTPFHNTEKFLSECNVSPVKHPACFTVNTTDSSPDETAAKTASHFGLDVTQ